MTEGLTALSEDDFLAARAAFRMAQELMPGSPEPGDGLMQVDQGIRLGNISALEYEASTREGNENWQESAHAYSRILELDSDLSFAQDGLTRSKEMIALHDQLDKYIEKPDSLSSPRTMQFQNIELKPFRILSHNNKIGEHGFDDPAIAIGDFQ